MRYFEDRPGDLDRARAAAAAWRERHPAGTADELAAAAGCRSDGDYSAVLRAALHAVDRHLARQATGVLTGQARAVQ